MAGKIPQVRAARKGTFREQFWATLRMYRRQGQPLCMAELAAVTGASPSTTNTYIQQMRALGYIAMAAPARRGLNGQPARYRLVKDTGPRNPILRNDGTARDRNLRREITGPEDLEARDV